MTTKAIILELEKLNRAALCIEDDIDRIEEKMESMNFFIKWQGQKIKEQGQKIKDLEQKILKRSPE